MGVWVESLAARVRWIAGVSEDEPVLASELARRLLGTGGLGFDASFGDRAMLVRRNKDWKILVGERVQDVRWAVAVELARWVLAEVADGPPPEGRVENGLALALIAPPRALERAQVPRAHPRQNLVSVAYRLGIRPSLAHLRISEVFGGNRAVVFPDRSVECRGDLWASLPVADLAYRPEVYRTVKRVRRMTLPSEKGPDRGAVFLVAG